MSAAPLLDNLALRALCSMPAARPSTSTALAVPELPARESVTGDDEVDAVLWLQKVVSTGQPPLIAKALEAAKLITTPMKVLGNRYAQYLLRKHPGNTMAAAFGSMNFGELEKAAETAVAREQRRHAALSQFGTVEEILAKTPAEVACEKALRGVKKSKTFPVYDDKADGRFLKVEALTPHTLADCLHVQVYADQIYRLRNDACAGDAGDHWPAFQAYDDFAFRMMQRIAPCSAAEALAVLEHMIEEDKMDRTESEAILRNLIGGRQ